MGNLRDVEPTWQILPDPLSRDVYDSAESAPVAETARAGGRLFGYGLLRPFRRDSNTEDFVTGEGAALIRAAVGLVLGTICQSETTMGELPWRTEFGSLLQGLRLRNNNTMLTSVFKQYVIDALERWVPAVDVVDVVIVQGKSQRFYLKVVYDVLDPAGTRVLVPGLQTAIPVG